MQDDNARDYQHDHRAQREIDELKRKLSLSLTREEIYLCVYEWVPPEYVDALMQVIDQKIASK